MQMLNKFAGYSPDSRPHSEEKLRIRHAEASVPRSAIRDPGNQCRKGHGFSLVEMLIIMAILLTITALAVPNLMAAIDQAKIARAVGDIKAIEDNVAIYETLLGNLPDDLSQVGDGNLLDPWGHPYQYLNHSTMKGNGKARKDRFLVPLNSDYDLYSMGKDGKSSPPITAKNSQDDIIRASNGAYTGLASQF